jgi:hypothetical protein
MVGPRKSKKRNFKPQLNTKNMQDLLKRISEKAGITATQAESALEAVKGYVSEKVPAVGSMLEGWLQQGAETGKELGAEAKEMLDKAGDNAEEMLGDVKEKLAPIADKVEDALKSFGSKIGDLLDGDDTPKKEA